MYHDHKISQHCLLSAQLTSDITAVLLLTQDIVTANIRHAVLLPTSDNPFWVIVKLLNKTMPWHHYSVLRRIRHITFVASVDDLSPH